MFSKLINCSILSRKWKKAVTKIFFKENEFSREVLLFAQFKKKMRSIVNYWDQSGSIDINLELLRSPWNYWD